MMKPIRRLAALLAILPLLAGLPAQAKETLVSPDLPGFVVGFAKVNANQSIREEIPQGETIQRWSKMVTTQWFRNLADRITPAEYANSMLAQLPRSCPGATASAVQTLSGQEAVRFKVVCPSTATGLAESFFLLAIAGEDDMHVKQVAFRGEASSDDFLWARKFLTGVYLCRREGDDPKCED